MSNNFVVLAIVQDVNHAIQTGLQDKLMCQLEELKHMLKNQNKNQSI